jgi:hypothetical protein
MRRSKTSVFLVALAASLVAIAASCSKPPAESGRLAEAPSQGAGELVPQNVAPEESAETSGDAQVAAGDTASATPEPADATAPVEPTPPAEPAASVEADATAAPLAIPEDTNMAADAAGEPARTPDIHFVPTPQDVVDRMLELAQVTKDDLVYDLGCGDGRIVATAAKTYGCKAVGFDIDPQTRQGVPGPRARESGRGVGDDPERRHLRVGPDPGQRRLAVLAAATERPAAPATAGT